MTRPAHISPTDWYRMPWHARAKITAAAAKANRDVDNEPTYRREPKRHACPDCGAPISRDGFRCKSCAARHRMLNATKRNPNGTVKAVGAINDNHCADCGVSVGPTATRCHGCDAKQRLIVDKPCADCGALTMRRRERCDDCQKVRHLRLERERKARIRAAEREAKEARQNEAAA